MYTTLAAVLLALMTLLAAPVALDQDTSPTDPTYLDKLAQLAQYGPSCKPAVGPDVPALPCADPTAPTPESSGASDQSQGPPCGYDYCNWYQGCHWEYWAW